MTTERAPAWIADAVGLVFLTAVSALPVVLVVVPRIQAASSAKAAQADLDLAQSTHDAEEKKLEMINQELAEVRRSLEKSTNDSYQKRSLNQLTDAMPTLAKEEGVTLAGIAPSEPRQDDDGLTVTDVTLEGHAAFPSFTRFVERIETEFPDLHLVEFKINSDPSQQEGRWKIVYKRISHPERTMMPNETPRSVAL